MLATGRQSRRGRCCGRYTEVTPSACPWLVFNRCPSLPLDSFPVYAQYFFSGTKPSSAPYRQLRAYLRCCAIVPRRHTSLSYFKQTTFHFPDNDVRHTVTESLCNHTASDHKEGELEDRRNNGESSCNFGDGTDQRVHSLMFMMMMASEWQKNIQTKVKWEVLLLLISLYGTRMFYAAVLNPLVLWIFGMSAIKALIKIRVFLRCLDMS